MNAGGIIGIIVSAGVMSLVGWGLHRKHQSDQRERAGDEQHKRRKSQRKASASAAGAVDALEAVRIGARLRKATEDAARSSYIAAWGHIARIDRQLGKIARNTNRPQQRALRAQRREQARIAADLEQRFPFVLHAQTAS